MQLVVRTSYSAARGVCGYIDNLIEDVLSENAGRSRLRPAPPARCAPDVGCTPCFTRTVERAESSGCAGRALPIPSCAVELAPRPRVIRFCFLTFARGDKVRAPPMVPAWD